MSQPPKEWTAQAQLGLDTLDWVPTEYILQFNVGPLRLAEARLRALKPDVPFNKRVKDPLESLPWLESLSWEECPSGIDALYLPAQPSNEEALSRIRIEGKFIRYIPLKENRYYVDLEGSFSQYLKKFSAKSRGNLVRSVRAFAKHCGGQIYWREFKTGEEMPEFYRLGREVSEKSYQHKLHFGLPNSDVFGHLIAEKASLGLVMGYILFHDENPIAYILCPIQEDCIVYHKIGFDPDFSSWSPGTVLLYVVLERLFAEQRFRVLDFGPTEFGYKAFFSTGHIRCARVLYVRRSFKHLALVHAHLVYCSVYGLMGKMLEAIRLKAIFKKALAQLSTIRRR